MNDVKTRLKILKQVGGQFKQAYKENTLTDAVVEQLTNELKKIEYEYSTETYPDLIDTDSFECNNPATPTNLAEALLWKLGKWKSYKNFIQYYKDDFSKPNNDIVFFAFAKHLKNNQNPILDQHTLRAMIFLNPELTPEAKNNLNKYLKDSSGKWKASGSGPTSKQCYIEYKKFIAGFRKRNMSIKKLDRFLMLFGSAVKENWKYLSNPNSK